MPDLAVLLQKMFQGNRFFSAYTMEFVTYVSQYYVLANLPSIVQWFFPCISATAEEV
jgi:hypothetical protein